MDDPLHINSAKGHSPNTAVTYADARGTRVTKDSKLSPRRIDLTMAAVMAHDRAKELAGKTFKVGSNSPSETDRVARGRALTALAHWVDVRKILSVKWVTRARPKTDRIACPWLIRRFIDPDAEILYVPPDQVLDVAKREGARSFDAPGAEFTHQDGKCSFEVLIQAFGLSDNPALARLARIVHAADVSEDRETDPLGPGLEAIGAGGILAEADDQTLLRKGSFVYDALFAWCENQAGDE